MKSGIKINSCALPSISVTQMTHLLEQCHRTGNFPWRSPPQWIHFGPCQGRTRLVCLCMRTELVPRFVARVVSAQNASSRTGLGWGSRWSRWLSRHDRSIWVFRSPYSGCRWKKPDSGPSSGTCSRKAGLKSCVANSILSNNHEWKVA